MSVLLSILLTLSSSLFDELLDPEYLEFLQFISKPVERLPSAEIQLESKEAERAGQCLNVDANQYHPS